MQSFAEHDSVETSSNGVAKIENEENYLITDYEKLTENKNLYNNGN